ncbi:GUN4 domain-containing protein [Aerosakkonema funiforme]|uniref:GUN4 domain-containing protein n=1 Tax=Aerosakkonema funiforme TaxID=1246630 RepID=UPI0035BB9AB6
MEILHIDLKLIGNKYAEFRYFWDNPNNYQCCQLPLTQIADLIERSETDYYTLLPEDYTKTGQLLYNWLDGTDRILQNAINQHKREGIILAIAASEGLAHLPWEILHDGKGFLVERKPGIVPIRWVKDENHRQLTLKEQPANRALNVLFMATSPLGIQPELDFEAEEAQILEATKRQPLCLIVEESGCLKELGYLVEDYEKNYFDIVHITGHATICGEKAYFITETEFGEAKYSSAADIATELQFQYPQLIFLSGCRTGYLTNEGTIPSMAEELLKQGATAVLGWGEKVLDTDAAKAAGILYQELSAGKTVTEALSCTYQALLRMRLQDKQVRDWHLLRLYVAETIPGALVRRGPKPVPRRSVVQEFLDPEKKLRVATRETFVGRRRQLQNCLRVLKTNTEQIGVLIHGMGGLGKSTIAARLCDRLSEFEKVIGWRQIDESGIVNKLADKLVKPEFRELRQELLDSHEELKYKLANLFSELSEKPFLLVFDDFEWNLEARQGRYVLKPEAAQVLSALVWAIQETYTNHRIVITCRYDFESDLLDYFYKQPLEAFRKSDLKKKLNRLKTFNCENIEPQLIERAKALADGNPRLLEYLNDEVLGKPDAAAKLTRLEQSPEEWKEKIIWPDLYQLIDEPLQRVLSHCLIYEIPVPMTALERVSNSRPNYQKQLQRARELGLIEISPDVQEENQVFRVSRILPHIIPQSRLPEAPAVYSLYNNAHKILHQLWGNEENRSEEKWQEIFRLLFGDRENTERFRQGFYDMLAVENHEADRALESEVRQLKDELSTENLCRQLEDYLSQQEWRKADEETAWIFYQVMVQEGYTYWYEVCKNFPCETLRQIDQLWIDNSQGRFGFSIQKQIWESVGGHPDADSEIYEKFGDKVGWRWGELTFNDDAPFDDAPFGHLPARCATPPAHRVTGWMVAGGLWRGGGLPMVRGYGLPFLLSCLA